MGGKSQVSFIFHPLLKMNSFTQHINSEDQPNPLSPAPALFYTPDRKPIIQLVRATILGTTRSPRPDDMPALTTAQRRALDTVEHLASRFGTTLDRQEGDIQYINNLSIMHARTAYLGEEKSSRHLLRMFLREMLVGWEYPEEYREEFEESFKPGRPQGLNAVDTDPWRMISGPANHG